jgi:hypothetical protein
MFIKSGHLNTTRLMTLYVHSVFFAEPENTAGKNILKSFWYFLTLMSIPQREWNCVSFKRIFSFGNTSYNYLN